MKELVDMSPLSPQINELCTRIIGCAITVHRELGPGLLESIYERALVIELAEAAIPTATQVEVPVTYRGHTVGDHRIDLLVANSVVIELKSLASLLPVHEAQTLTYLKLGQYPLGLPINFNVPMVSAAIRRILNPNWRSLPPTKLSPVIVPHLRQSETHANLNR